MSRRRTLGAALAWLTVVATVSAMVWVVISRAGDGLVASGRPVTTTGSSQTIGSPATPSGRSSRRPSKTPSRTPSGTPSRAPSATASNASPSTPTPSTTVTPTTTVAPTTAPTTSAPPTSPASPTGQPSSSATEQRRTWQGQAGTLVVSCGGTGIRLVSAQPANGFRADVHREDALIDVEFEGREDESGIKVTVVARCVAGVPAFSTRSEQRD